MKMVKMLYVIEHECPKCNKPFNTRFVFDNYENEKEVNYELERIFETLYKYGLDASLNVVFTSLQCVYCKTIFRGLGINIAGKDYLIVFVAERPTGTKELINVPEHPKNFGNC